MLEGLESPKSHYKIVLPENETISAFYTINHGEIEAKGTKVVNLAQIWTYRPLIRPITHQRVMIERADFPKSLHKLVLPENVSISAFYRAIPLKLIQKS